MLNGSYVAGDASSYGSYYNGRVANALSVTITISLGTTYNTNICSKNWTLADSSSRDYVVNNYSSIWNHVYAGVYDGSKGLVNNGTTGYYWTRTTQGSNRLHTFNTKNKTLSTNDDPVSAGRSVRCVVKNTTSQDT